MNAVPDPADERRGRRAAATRFDLNFVVTAGAGTGKTALLVERALNLIGSGAAAVGSLAVITFTEKAAAELRERLTRGLERLRLRAAGGAAPEELDEREDADRAWSWLREAGVAAGAIEERALAALTGLDAAAIATIHAFCSEILRRYPREADIDPGFAVDEGARFEALFREAFERFLADELGPRGRRAGLWRRALSRPGALEAVSDLGREMARAAIDTVPPAGGALDLLAAAARAALVPIAAVRRRAIHPAPLMGRFLEAAAVFLEALAGGGPQALASARAGMPLEEFLERDPPEPGAKLEGAAPEEVEAAARRGHRLIAAAAAVDEETISVLVEAALPLARSAREAALASGQVSFDDLLRLTHRLLERHPAIRRALADRYRFLLVDEFQDTDPLQYRILFFLAEADGAPARDAYEAALEPGRLFIVGDPKQSIYRFRGADIEAYHRAVGRVSACGGALHDLATSHRSPDDIVEPINRLFSALIGPKDEEERTYEPIYRPIRSARGGAPDGGPRVEIWSVEAGGRALDRRRAEAQAIAAWIVENAGAREATGQPLRLRQTAILMRSLGHAGLYARALRLAGVRYLIEGGKDFQEHAEVGDLMSFLTAAANPNDAAAVLAVMRSPLGAVADEELARHAAAGGRLDDAEAEPDPALCPGVARTLELLRAFRTRMRGRAADAIVRAALEETPLALLHASVYEGAQRLANLRKLCARAEAHARQGLSLLETLDALEEEFEGERAEGESPLADERVEAVRILSVHKAKGLEFPVVFVPDLARGARIPPEKATRAVRLDPGGGARLGVRLARGETNAAWVVHEESRLLHEAAEEKRVFYVACTRAQERLILVNSSARGKAPWRDALAALGYSLREGPPPDGLLGRSRVLHRRVRPVSPAAVPAPAEEPSIWREPARLFEQVTASFLAAARGPVRWPAGASDAEAAGETGDESGWRPPGPAPAPGDAEVARAAGAAVHAGLEAWDFRSAERLREQVERAARRIAGERGTDAAAAVAEARRIVEAFLASPLPAALREVETLGREVPILFRDDAGALWTGACDLVYRDREGRIVAADYKTDRVAGDVRQAAERYRAQVEIYVAALRRALAGATVRGEILFIRSGTIVPL